MRAAVGQRTGNNPISITMLAIKSVESRDAVVQPLAGGIGEARGSYKPLVLEPTYTSFGIFSRMMIVPDKPVVPDESVVALETSEPNNECLKSCRHEREGIPTSMVQSKSSARIPEVVEIESARGVTQDPDTADFDAELDDNYPWAKSVRVLLRKYRGEGSENWLREEASRLDNLLRGDGPFKSNAIVGDLLRCMNRFVETEPSGPSGSTVWSNTDTYYLPDKRTTAIRWLYNLYNGGLEGGKDDCAARYSPANQRNLEIHLINYIVRDLDKMLKITISAAASELEHKTELLAQLKEDEREANEGEIQILEKQIVALGEVEREYSPLVKETQGILLDMGVESLSTTWYEGERNLYEAKIENMKTTLPLTRIADILVMDGFLDWAGAKLSPWLLKTFLLRDILPRPWQDPSPAAIQAMHSTLKSVLKLHLQDPIVSLIPIPQNYDILCQAFKPPDSPDQDEDTSWMYQQELLAAWLLARDHRQKLLSPECHHNITSPVVAAELEWLQEWDQESAEYGVINPITPETPLDCSQPIPYLHSQTMRSRQIVARSTGVDDQTIAHIDLMPSEDERGGDTEQNDFAGETELTEGTDAHFVDPYGFILMTYCTAAAAVAHG